MRKRKKKFNSHLISLVWVLGIQFLALPFYHFHPDTQHSHPGESSHHHNAYFHSVELESIVHLTHSHDHNSADHHSQHSESNGEGDQGVELNNETLKSKDSFKVLKVSLLLHLRIFRTNLKRTTLRLKVMTSTV